VQSSGDRAGAKQLEGALQSMKESYLTVKYRLIIQWFVNYT